jgi:hypothetical protein
MRGMSRGLAFVAWILCACGSNGSAPSGDGGQHVDAHPNGPDAPASLCGNCPTGYTCGSANGTPVCRAPSGVPLFKHIFVIVMENTSASTLAAATNTPYLTSLAMQGVSLSDYHGVTHPSLPNYIAMTSGDDYGIGCDCTPDMSSMCNGFNCSAILSTCGCEQIAHNLADDLEAAGRTWRDYAEGMGTPCNTTSSGDYAVKHVPFLYYDDVQSDAPRCMAHVVDYTELAADLAAGNAPSFSIIAPNLTHDMHNPIPAGAQNLANGDMWLSQEVPKILASPAYTDGGLVVIVWDEDDLSGLFAPDDPIPFIAVSKLAKSAYTSTVKGDHYALLATIEDGLGLPRLGNAIGATPLVDLFPAN